ncbi:hypothetical protein KVH27_19440 [Streptomyces olivaceus]|uniref:DUF6221 family protein n=1 Tax=Streptomyces olivaceus TaxID=47716 RepID=UPI001CCD9F63|nr:DUF6221 family protein [Streptomyces olivaceus]MBZ6250542.1 hypothetical protein [Streptomyces olivaceus]
MGDLVQWLRAQLDDDAEAAQRAFSGQLDPENGWGAYRPEGQRHTTITPHVGMIHEAVQADHVIAWNPARALREIDAKRQIVALCEPPLVDVTGPGDTERSFMPGEGPPWGMDVLKLLALPYADRPSYRDEWRP